MDTSMEIGLKSFIMSKLDNQMSKSWKQIVSHVFETANKFGQLKTGVPDHTKLISCVRV